MKGIGVSPGIVIGRVYIDWREQYEIEKEYVEDASLEADRLYLALESIQSEVEEKEGVDGWLALYDPEFVAEAREMILTEKVNASWALQECLNRFEQHFQGLDAAARVDRMTDLSNRVNRLLMHVETVLTPDDLPGPRVLVCKSVSREDMSLLQEGKVVGLVCQEGTQWSHGLIAAKDNYIPAVIGVPSVTDLVDQGDVIIVDGNRGNVELSPDDETLADYEKMVQQYQEHTKMLQKLIGLPCRTADGELVTLRGNASTFADVQRLAELQSGGIGLYRTEYLYLSRDKLPTVGEQYYDYKRALDAMPGCSVIIRTLDVGGDKMPPYLAMPKESNPALGYRGIRYSLNRLDIFRVQMKALLQASAHGDLGIMLPLVNSVTELRAARAILEDLKTELTREGENFNPHVRLGVMIETPAAAMEASIFAREADFLSIGSNDLVQYALAIDRNDPQLVEYYSPYSPGALRLVQQIIQAGNDADVTVSMCGEMASDPCMVPLLYGMGLRNFSVNPPVLTRTHWIISQLCEEECRACVDDVMNLTSAEEIKNYLTERFGEEQEA